jgi:hypothetical protein
MEWLGQNWLWIVLAIGAFFLMTRMGGGCGMGSSGATIRMTIAAIRHRLRRETALVLVRPSERARLCCLRSSSLDRISGAGLLLRKPPEPGCI